MNGIKIFIIDFYLDHETIYKLNKRNQRQIFHKMLRKDRKHSKSVTENGYYYDEAIKHLNQSRKKLLLKV